MSAQSRMTTRRARVRASQRSMRSSRVFTTTQTAYDSSMSGVRDRLRLWRMQRAERSGTLSSDEQNELRRLQEEHGTIHIGEPRARMYDYMETDSKKPRY
jgi:hypothetical protein